MRRRLRALVLLLPLALPAVGCGIRATDVVEVGEAAVIQVAPGDPDRTVLYFVYDGQLRPVARVFMAPQSEKAEAEGMLASGRAGGSWTKALAMLFEGPDELERQAGLRTELPSDAGGVILGLEESGVVVRLKFAVAGFSALARRQLVCTAAEVVAPGGNTPVTVKGSDGSFGPDACTL